jgi:hypothetical protein
MRGQRKKLLLIAITGIIIVCLIMIFISIGKKRKTAEDSKLEDTVTYITKQVIDYPDDNNGSPLIWEIIYYEKSSISIVYGNGKEIKRFSGGIIDKVVDFSPEVKGNLESRVDDTIPDDDMGIIYSLNMDQSLSYVAGLMENGYKLMRKVLMADYAEVYIKSPQGKILRILALPDKMLMAELDKNAVLDDIDSYFD